jgi:hypothetical protein
VIFTGKKKKIRRKEEEKAKMAATDDFDNLIFHTKCGSQSSSALGARAKLSKMPTKSSVLSLTHRGFNKSITLLLLILCFVFKLNLCYGFILDGSQNSFAQYRKWYTGLNGSLELEFKTEQPNGLVLYTDDGGTYDFFELKLVEGALRLRYNLGGGAQIITVGRDLHDSHWHKVQVSFYFYFKFFSDKVKFCLFYCLKPKESFYQCIVNWKLFCYIAI